MMDKNLEYLLNEYAERMEMLSVALARGACTSYEEYKYACGQLRGLEAACNVIKDLQRNLENSDE
jgi:hypothetical protein